MTQESLYAILEDRYGKEHRVAVGRTLCNGKDYPNEIPTDSLHLSIGDCTNYYVYLYWNNYSPCVELLFAEIDKQLLWWASRNRDNTILTKEQQIEIIAKQLLEKLMK